MAVCANCVLKRESLRDLRDRAILMAAFASGGRWGSEIAGLCATGLQLLQQRDKAQWQSSTSAGVIA